MTCDPLWIAIVYSIPSTIAAVGSVVNHVSIRQMQGTLKNGNGTPTKDTEK